MKNLEKWLSRLDRLYLIFFGLLYGILFFSTSSAITIHGQPEFDSVLLILAYVAIAVFISDYAFSFYLRLTTADSAEKRALYLQLFLRLLIISFTYMYWMNGYLDRQALTIFLTILLAVTADHISARKLLQLAFRLGVILVAACYILSMMKLMPNFGGTAFGFIYRTDYACHLLCLSIIYFLLNIKKISWKDELLLLILILFDWKVVVGKTAFICLILLLFGTCWHRYRMAGHFPYQDKSQFGPIIPILFCLLYLPAMLAEACVRALKPEYWRRFFKWICISSYLLFAAIILTMTLLYRKLPYSLLKVLDIVPTLKSRLILGIEAFESFPISLFGNNIRQIGGGGSEGGLEFYFFLDSTYIKLFLECGLVIFIISLGLMTWIQIRLCRKQLLYPAFLLALFALDCVMEHHMLDLSYNVFIILASAKLDLFGDPVQDISPKHAAVVLTEPAAKPIHSAWKKVLTIFITFIFLLWSITAYPISSSSIWTPGFPSTVTLLIPGTYADPIANDSLQLTRLREATKYLAYYKSAKCIVSGSKKKDDRASEASWMQDWLVENGISRDRIFLDETATSMDEALKNARSIIQQKELPIRLTVCSFAIQYAWLNRLAGRLDIPVTALEVPLPWYLYLPRFTCEQWRILSCFFR